MAPTSNGPVEYRLSGRGDRVVLICHGAHLSAGTPRIGERDFSTAGCRTLVISRPGCGRTPVSSGLTRDAFAHSMAQVCERLGITELAAVVGMSQGGPTAMTMAVEHPELVQRVILQASLSSIPWPDLTTKVVSWAGLNGITEGFSWFAMHQMLRMNRETGLALMLSALSTRPGTQVLADYSPRERREATAMFLAMRSGQGYVHDLLQTIEPALETAVSQPTLIQASPCDGQVPLKHAERLAAAIPNSRLAVTGALSHLIWFGSHAGDVRREVHAHLERPGRAHRRRSRTSQIA